eukprot:556028-Alexandrium_andersonii.AAC.1
MQRSAVDAADASRSTLATTSGQPRAAPLARDLGPTRAAGQPRAPGPPLAVLCPHRRRPLHAALRLRVP